MSKPVSGRMLFRRDAKPINFLIAEAAVKTAAILAFAIPFYAQPCQVRTIAGRQAAFAGEGTPAIDAVFFDASSIAHAANGRFVVTDRLNRRVRAFTEGGSIRTIAGTGAYGDSGDGGPASFATFRSPTHVTADRSGNIYVVDSEARRIRRIGPGGEISHFAGTGIWRYSGDGGLASLAGFGSIDAIATGPDGSVYVLDGIEACVRRISPQGIISRYAGRRRPTNSGPNSGDPPDFTGPATSATFREPNSIAVDGKDNLFVSDRADRLIRKVAPDGIISRFAGGGIGGTSLGDGGLALNASVTASRIAADSSGIVYVMQEETRVRRILLSGIIEAFVPGFFRALAPIEDGRLMGVRLDSVFRLAAGSDPLRVAGINLVEYSGDGRFALGSPINLTQASGIVALPGNSVLFSDTTNGRVRRISSDGTIATIAGGGTMMPTIAGIPATTAQLGAPEGLALDGEGNLFIADRIAQRIFRLDPKGILTIIAGNGGSTGMSLQDSGSPARFVSLFAPRYIAVNSVGDVFLYQFIFNQPRYTIWRIQASDGRIYIANLNASGLPVFQPIGPLSADGEGNVLALTNQFTALARIAPDGAVSSVPVGPIFTDTINRRGFALGRQGLVAGAGYSLRLSNSPDAVSMLGHTSTWTNGSSDDGPARDLRLGTLGSLTFDGAGNLLVVDWTGFRIRRISAGCTVSSQPTALALVDGAFKSSEISPGGAATFFGQALGPTNGEGANVGQDGKVTSQIAGSRVLFDGIPAPMLFARSDQLNFMVPYSMEGRRQFYVQTEYNGIVSEPRLYLGELPRPSLFIAGTGPSGFYNSDWSINSSSNPARPGSIVFAYMNAVGPTMPAGVDGLPNTSPLPKPILPIEVTVAGFRAEIEFLGGAPGIVAGIMQMNMRIPASFTGSQFCRVFVRVTNADTFTESGVFVGP